MRFLRRSLAGIFLLGLTVALLAYAGRTVWTAVDARVNAEPQAFPQRERVATVTVATIEPQTVAPILTVFGELRSTRTLSLRIPVGGTVEWLAADFVEGGTVQGGDPLLRIDPAEAGLGRARADLADADAERRDAIRALDLAEDELAAAEAQAALRDRALARQTDLQSRGVGTAPDLEAAELAASSARQAVLAAREAIAQAEARIDQSATLVARAEIAVEDAERTLLRTELTAPFSGQLADASLAMGARVTANEEVATLVDPAAIEVSFRVSAAQYARLVEEGGLVSLPVTVALEVDGLELTAAGRITREAATVGEGQTGRLIFAELDSAAGFRPGDFVTVRIEEPPLDGVALLPAAAVGADGAVLAIGADDRLELAEVEVLRRQGDEVLVDAGALAGTEVVAERSPLLGAGLKVQRANRPATETAAADPEMIELDADRRARLLDFVQSSPQMPEEARSRLLAQLAEPRVPAEVVARLEDRMGG